MPHRVTRRGFLAAAATVAAAAAVPGELAAIGEPAALVFHPDAFALTMRPLDVPAFIEVMREGLVEYCEWRAVRRIP